MKGQGQRKNEGKLRYDLIHPVANKGLVSVLTKGAEKYAERNWEKGMKWSKVIASLKRHLAAIEQGEDYDEETGELHADHLQANAHFLSSYYTIYPEGDDRPHKYLDYPKIGLDIDEVLCGWVKGWTEKFDLKLPNNWSFSYNNKEYWERFDPEELKSFYLSLDKLIDSSDIPFEPHCYITARRSIGVDITKQWLENHGFAAKPVYSVGFGESKVEAAKEAGVEVFVDDNFENFVQLNKAGICCYLLTAEHNKRYNVGHKRIDSLKNLPWFR